MALRLEDVVRDLGGTVISEQLLLSSSDEASGETTRQSLVGGLVRAVSMRVSAAITNRSSMMGTSSSNNNTSTNTNSIRPKKSDDKLRKASVCVVDEGSETSLDPAALEAAQGSEADQSSEPIASPIHSRRTDASGNANSISTTETCDIEMKNMN